MQIWLWVALWHALVANSMKVWWDTSLSYYQFWCLEVPRVILCFSSVNVDVLIVNWVVRTIVRASLCMSWCFSSIENHFRHSMIVLIRTVCVLLVSYHLKQHEYAMRMRCDPGCFALFFKTEICVCAASCALCTRHYLYMNISLRRMQDPPLLSVIIA